MTFLDARNLQHNSVLETDVCIVGAGAAGITMAQSMDGRGYRVCVLESGDIEKSAANQLLYRGRRTGLRYPPLEQSRLRYFGGTTNHWAGWCRPPNRHDFLPRRWVPGSGWPLSLDELAPYLKTAESICDLEPHGFETETWATSGNDLLPLDSTVFKTMITRFSPPTRFAEKYQKQLRESHLVSLYLNANVVSLDVQENGKHVYKVNCRTLSGRQFSVVPRIVILATGGIENARILLASRGNGPLGLGNENDVLGRYFMDHFKLPVGTLNLQGGGSLAFYQQHNRRGSSLKGVIGLTPSALHDHRMTPVHFEFNPAGTWTGGRRYTINARIDPAPNRESRIGLDSDVDSLGMRRVRVNLHYGDIEKQTFASAVRLIRRGLHEARLGRLQLIREGSDSDLLDISRVSAIGFHHMGATRMSDDPSMGVVNRHGRVFSVDNLYVAGCSVFPGYEGYPTMTLVALALRLVDHLESQWS